MSMDKKFTCIAIDDEIVALKIISSLIEKTDILNLIDTYQDASEGAAAILSKKPDIVFLDIQMPQLSGMEILKNLNSKPEIILVTSQEGYAEESYEFDVTDYLIKPIENYGRFLKAVDKAVNNIAQNSPKVESENIFVKADSLLVKLNSKDISYLEAFGDYIKVHTDQKTYITHGRMMNADKILPTDQFARIHRSYIVRIDRIVNIDVSNLQIGDKILPISNSYKEQLLSKLKML